MDNILELGGRVDLIATAICDFTTPTKTYKTGDIVLSLNDVSMTPYYREHSVNITSLNNDLAYNDYNLNSLSFANVPLDQQIHGLFAAEAEETYKILTQETITPVGTQAILQHTKIDTTSIKIAGIDDFTVAQANDITVITSSDFEEDEIYTVQYSYTISGFEFALQSLDANIPYLKLQIVMHGNNAKTGISGYMFVPAARLRYIPEMNFTNTSVSYCRLQFIVIDNKEDKPHIVMVNE